MAEQENMSLYDEVSEGLEAGTWILRTSQELQTDGKLLQTDGLSTEQKFQVENAIFSVRREDIVQRMPISGSQGSYTEDIPHLVIKGCIHVRQSGHFLLLLKKDEIQGRAVRTAGEYGQESDYIRSSFEKLSKKSLENKYTFIQLKAELLEQLLPTESEFPYFYHYRQVYIGNKPEMNLDGMFTVLLSNRLPEYVDGQGCIYEVHLTSILGLGSALKEEKNKDKSTVEIISLDSWEFTVSGKSPRSFRHICAQMKENVNSEWLYRLEDIGAASGRLQHGFVPMEYQTRLGDSGICWNRSPFLPCQADKMRRASFYQTADGALCYDGGDCMFDVTYAVAFETGRMAAIRDEAYIASLLSFRRELQKKVDSRYMDRIWRLGSSVTDSLGQLLEKADWDVLGEALACTELEKGSAQSVMRNPVEDKVQLEQFIRDKAEEAAAELKELIDPVTGWLAKLLLLYPVPLENLIPHKALLPKESVRFFYMDPNWQQALLEGALSLGLYSRRQSLFNQVMRKILEEGTQKAMYAYRAGLYQMEPPQVSEAPMTGFLLHADVAALWPTLSVEALDKEGRELAILRMQHIGSKILLTIFDGVADQVIVNEPEECLCLKVDREKYGFFRNNSTVLHLNPDGGDGLIGALERECSQAVGPALFARHFMTLGQRTVFGRRE